MPKIIQLQLLVLLWSFTGILGELVTLDSASLVFWRTALASASLWLYLRTRQPGLLRLPNRKNLLLALASGLIIGFHWLCFFCAIALSNVSVGLAGFASTSLFTALLEPLTEKRRPQLFEMLLSLLVAGGLLLITRADANVPNATAGILVALLGALLAAVYSLFSKHLVRTHVPGPTVMLYQFPAANLAPLAGLLLIPNFTFQLPATTDWPPLLALALACTVGAYLWYTRLLKTLTAYTINLAVNLEPVYGILMAAALFQEHHALTPQFYLGTLTILTANLLHTLKR